MTTTEVMAELKSMGCQTTKNTFLKHGAKEPFFGVKVQDLKKIQKKVKKSYTLALELFQTGNSDAMYLAGLIADENKMTRADLNEWAEKANWYMISGFSVAWVTAESEFGYELALEWINSKKENIATSGWATLSSLVGIKPDAELKIKEIEKLLTRVEKEIHKAPNRVRYCMNGFVIAVGAGIKELSPRAIETAKKIGQVYVDMNGTSCKTPFAPDYIKKIIDKGKLGHKKKMARC